jgi:hypothetical protein
VAGGLLALSCASCTGVFSGDQRAGPRLTLSDTLEVRHKPAAPIEAEPPWLRLKLSQTLAAVPGTPPFLAAGQSYLDQYLHDEPDAPADTRDAPASGRYSLGAEYRMLNAQHSALDEDLVEQGLMIRTHQETLNWGVLRMNVTLRDRSHDNSFAADTDRGTASGFLLAQDHMPIATEWTADQQLGDIRAGAPRLISSSRRVTLPSTTARGYRADFNHADQRISVQAARAGRLEGITAHTFSGRPGNLLGLGFEGVLLPQLEYALHFGQLRNDETVPDHEHAALAFRLTPGGADEYRLGALTANDALGAWLDAETHFGTWRHRYGLYRLEPDLPWINVATVTDRQGAHWRTDIQRLLGTVSLGADYERSNVERNPSRPERNALSGFLSGSTLLSPTTRVGTTLSGRWIDPDVNSAGSEWKTVIGDVFGSLRWTPGVTRLQLRLARNDLAGIERDDVSLTWSQQWSMFPHWALSTALGGEYSFGADRTDRRVTGGISFRRELPGDWQISGDFSSGRITRDADGLALYDDRSYGAALNAFWRIARELDASLSINRNRRTQEAVLAGTRETDTRILFSLRYSTLGGTAYERLGQPGGTGAGRISGRVFFDENRDGLFTPGESPLAGLTVILDGRITARTDAEGRFEFWPVHAGTHRLRIAIEDVPLPWSLDDDSPRIIELSPRSQLAVDFALIRFEP